MNIFIKIATIFFLFLILIIVSTGAFIGAGYVLSSLLPLTLFQCCVLSVSATFVSAFIIVAFLISELFIGIVRSKPDNILYKEEQEDEEADEDEGEEEIRQASDRRKFTVISKNRVRRNELCPCGSGKKYKYCCGK